MPASNVFKSESGYQATLAHELTHWTGHKSRLDRLSIARFGSNEYAAEELVAELGAAFLCAHLGIATEHREDHAAYLNAWLAGLKAEPKMLWTVASKAQAALDHLISYQPTENICPDNLESLARYGAQTVVS
jgi:antirestriction protein ArdC